MTSPPLPAENGSVEPPRSEGEPMFDEHVERYVKACLLHPERTYMLQTAGPLYRTLTSTKASSADRMRAVEQVLIEAVKWARR